MPEIILTDKNFENEVLRSAAPVLVDFWAPWCGPCQVQGPIINELAKEIKNAKIAKLNVDENQKTASKFGVMSIPTLMIFKNGSVLEQMVGPQQKADLKRKLEAAI